MFKDSQHHIYLPFTKYYIQQLQLYNNHLDCVYSPHILTPNLSNVAVWSVALHFMIKLN